MIKKNKEITELQAQAVVSISLL